MFFFLAAKRPRSPAAGPSAAGVGGAGGSRAVDSVAAAAAVAASALAADRKRQAMDAAAARFGAKPGPSSTRTLGSFHGPSRIRMRHSAC